VAAPADSLQTFDSDGIEIAYLDTGATSAVLAVPVLLIHGFASNHAVNWVSTGWVDTLTKAGYRVIAVDNRGHGKSGKPYRVEDYGSPIMAEDARRLLDHLSIPMAHVIGYSMGARISAFLVINHPTRVASVTFAGLGINMLRGMGERGDIIAEALEASSIQDVASVDGRLFRAFAEQTGSDLRALAACMRSGRLPLTAEVVGSIACPVLVVVGTEDAIAGSALELAALIPGARAYEPAGKDHMKAVGDRGFKAEALAFLASTTNGSN
jgi:pimeloyl-ACP methyl ester carboxylesterase